MLENKDQNQLQLRKCRGSSSKTARKMCCNYRQMLPLTLLAIGVLYLYLWWVMDIPQMHHDRRRPFMWGSGFFDTFLGHAGGPVEYFHSLLLQLYSFSWVGAAILTGVFLAMYYGARRLIACYTQFSPLFTPLIPAILGIVLVSSRMTLVPLLALTTALYASLLYVCMPTNHSGARLLVFLAGTWLLYYAVSGAFLLFVIVCAVHEVTKRRRLLACVMLALGATVPWEMRFLLYEPDLLTLYFRNAPLEATVKTVNPLTVGMYLVMWAFFPVAILATEAGKTIWATRLREGLAKGILEHWTIRGTLIILTLGALAIPPILQTRHCSWTIAERLLDEEQWDEALDHILRLRTGDATISYMENRALFKTGRLLDEMFSYPQYEGAASLLMDGKQFDSLPRTSEKRSATYFDLGFMNRAERWTQEAMTVVGEVPLLMKRMVFINIVQGRPNVATVYLERLKNMPFQRRWVRDCELKLRNDPLLERDREIQHLRASMFKQDYVDTLTQEELLQFCLTTNPRNRMAFEYLMATYLLSRRPDKILENMRLLDNLGYTKIPKHYEEAVLSYSSKTGKMTTMIGKRYINPDTIRRFWEFRNIYAQHRMDTEAARIALSEDYGDTYWFFEIFSRSGRACTLH